MKILLYQILYMPNFVENSCEYVFKNGNICGKKPKDGTNLCGLCTYKTIEKQQHDNKNMK